MTSLQKLQEQLEKQIQNVEGKIERTNEIHHKLTHMSLTKADPNYKKSFSNSAFRNVLFKFKSYPLITHKVLECKKGQTITYSELCKLLTQYISINNLFNFENHTIICDDLLKLVTGNETTTFINLLKNIGKIIN